MGIREQILAVRTKPLASIHTSIGDVAIFPICGRDMVKLKESLGETLDRRPPEHFFKTLLPLICYLKESLGECDSRPDLPLLTSSDIERLSHEDLEQLAAVYLEKEPHLYREPLTKRTTDEEGRTTLLPDGYGNITYPRKENESSVHYLHRLLQIREKNDQESMRTLSRSSLHSTHFSTELSESISRTLSMGERLKRTMESSPFRGISDSMPTAADSLGELQSTDSLLSAARSVRKATAAPIEATFPGIDFDEMARDAVQARLAPSIELRERLDVLIDQSADSGNFLVEMNKTQVRIAGELKASAERASRFAKKTIYLTIIVICLTVLSYIDNRSGARSIESYVDRITSGLESIDKSLSGANHTRQGDLATLVHEMIQGRETQDSRFDMLLAEQARIIDQLQQQRTVDRETIEQLKNQVEEMGAKHKNTSK